MIKKMAAVITALLLVFSVFVHAAPSPDQLIYSPDFSGGGLPSGTDVIFGDDGYIGVEDSALVLEAAATYPPVTTVLFPHKVTESVFTYSADIVVRDYLSGNCWFSLCFCAVNEDLSYQFTAFCGDGGVCFRFKNGASSWKTLSSSGLHTLAGQEGVESFGENGIVRDTAVRFAVTVSNGVAYGTVDGVTVLEARIADGTVGYVGIDGRGVKLDVSNVTVSTSVPDAVSAADAFGCRTYRQPGGLCEPPLLIRRDKNTAGGYTADSARPGAVMMTVRFSSGVLHAYDGAVDLGPLNQRLELIKDLCIPAFFVSDDTAAAALSGYMTENGVLDAFVVVTRTSLLPLFRGNPYARLVLDLSSRDAADVSETVKTLYSNGIRTVMLSSIAADPDTVFALHKMLVSVWSSAGSSHSDEIKALLSGADAVVTADHASLSSFLSSVTDTLSVRRPVAVSDGGNVAAAPYGTLKAVLSALDKGASAVRLRVRSSRDGIAVLCEGETTVGMSSVIPVSSSGISSLKSLTYSDVRMSDDDRIATLEELFEKVYREYEDSVFHIDVYDKTTAERILTLADEYDMKQRCVILSDDPEILSAVALNGGASAYTGVINVWDGRGTDASLCSMIGVLCRYNSVYYGDPSYVPAEFLYELHDRGVQVVASSGEAGLLDGYDAFAAPSSETAKLPYGLYATVDADGRLNVKLRCLDGAERDVTALCSILPVSGSPVLSSGAVSGSGEFIVTCPFTGDDGRKYKTASQVLSVTEKGTETGAETEPQPSGGGTLTAAIIAGGAAVVVGGLLILGFMSRKRRKTEQEDA